MSKVWMCRIGSITEMDLPNGCDLPMRLAVEKAYFELTGKYPDGIFSGWGEEFSSSEKSVILNDYSILDEENP